MCRAIWVGLIAAVMSVMVGRSMASAEQQAGAQPAVSQPARGAPETGGGAGASGSGQALVLFDFEEDTQSWEIPDWAKESEDDVGKILSLSEDVASSGARSLQLLADFPGGRWTGAYVEVMMYVTDWSPFGSIAVDVYVPEGAPRGLKGRVILTIGEQWTWTEMNRGLPLEPGRWTTLTANLKPTSLDWKTFPTDAFRKDIRKVGIRIESDRGPVYTGPIYLDQVRLGQ